MVRSRGGAMAMGSGRLHVRRAWTGFPPPIWPPPGRSRAGDVGALVSVLRRHHLSLSALELSPACMRVQALTVLLCPQHKMYVVRQLLSSCHMQHLSTAELELV